MGHDFRAAQRQDWLCHVHLANPPRNRAQVSLGLGLGYDEDHALARLAYVDVVPEQYPEAMDYIAEQWCILYRTNILSVREYSEYAKTPNAHRDLLAWDGVHSIDRENSLEDIRRICRDCHAAARNDVISKLNQEQRQQQGKGKRKSHSEAGAPTSKAKGAQLPSSVSPTASASSSSWGWSSWSWGQWGEQRQWDQCDRSSWLESELGALELVEPSLNAFRASIIQKHDILVNMYCGFPPKSIFSSFFWRRRVNN